MSFRVEDRESHSYHVLLFLVLVLQGRTGFMRISCSFLSSCSPRLEPRDSATGTHPRRPFLCPGGPVFPRTRVPLLLLSTAALVVDWRTRDGIRLRLSLSPLLLPLTLTRTLAHADCVTLLHESD